MGEVHGPLLEVHQFKAASLSFPTAYITPKLGAPNPFYSLIVRLSEVIYFLLFFSKFYFGGRVKINYWIPFCSKETGLGNFNRVDVEFWF